MTKYNLVLLVFILFGYTSSAQSGFRSKVEVELKLIQKQDKQSGQIMALSLTIINRSGSDIFIPGFSAEMISGLTVYKKELSGYKKTSLYPTVAGCAVPPRPNKIVGMLLKQDKLRFTLQDSIFQAYLKTETSDNRLRLNNAIDQPFFLKANQRVENYTVVGLEELLKTNAEYKICFEPRVHENAKEFPDNIFNYQKYIPIEVEANTIYYQVIK
ncbi:hypothetical protein QTN47_04205 [Danxiaibacter flavus]|uniref:VIT domain-containing protein n=1 Tax=Danxiaibacter flavus TaxID=3049108 RepID=A0ABV3Z9Z1_9BACT|nr:hypothetical protein QNM32_04205 [Chitinophagaceae bacterium DXS]